MGCFWKKPYPVSPYACRRVRVAMSVLFSLKQHKVVDEKRRLCIYKVYNTCVEGTTSTHCPRYHSKRQR